MVDYKIAFKSLPFPVSLGWCFWRAKRNRLPGLITLWCGHIKNESVEREGTLSTGKSGLMSKQLKKRDTLRLFI